MASEDLETALVSCGFMMASEDLEGLIDGGVCCRVLLPCLVAQSQSRLWALSGPLLLGRGVNRRGEEWGPTSSKRGMDDSPGGSRFTTFDDGELGCCPCLALHNQCALGDAGGALPEEEATPGEPRRSRCARACSLALASICLATIRGGLRIPRRKGGASLISDPSTTAMARASLSVPMRLALVSFISLLVTMFLRQQGHSLWLFTSHSRMHSL